MYLPIFSFLVVEVVARNPLPRPHSNSSPTPPNSPTDSNSPNKVLQIYYAKYYEGGRLEKIKNEDLGGINLKGERIKVDNCMKNGL